MEEDKRDREYNVSPIRAYTQGNPRASGLGSLLGRPLVRYGRVVEFLPAGYAIFAGQAPWERPAPKAWVFAGEVEADERAYLAGAWDGE